MYILCVSSADCYAIRKLRQITVTHISLIATLGRGAGAPLPSLPVLFLVYPPPPCALAYFSSPVYSQPRKA